LIGSSSFTCTRPFPPLMMLVTGPTYISAEALEHNEMLEREMRELGQRHAATAATLRDAGLEAEAHIVSGNPTEQLLKKADCGALDFVAIGSRGLGPFRRALLGSVSEHVVKTRARQSSVGG